jgi:hypothetical protein
MNCEKCGAPLPPQFEFCPACTGGSGSARSSDSGFSPEKFAKVAGTVTAIALAAVIVRACTPSAQEQAKRDAAMAQVHAVSACQVELESKLREPESVKYTEKVAVKDGDTYRVLLTFRAKNGFGGYSAESRTCTYDGSRARIQ